MLFPLFVVSCGTGDIDKRDCLFVFKAHDSVGGSLTVLFRLVVR